MTALSHELFPLRPPHQAAHRPTRTPALRTADPPQCRVPPQPALQPPLPWPPLSHLTGAPAKPLVSDSLAIGSLKLRLRSPLHSSSGFSVSKSRTALSNGERKSGVPPPSFRAAMCLPWVESVQVTRGLVVGMQCVLLFMTSPTNLLDGQCHL